MKINNAYEDKLETLRHCIMKRGLLNEQNEYLAIIQQLLFNKIIFFIY